VGPALGILDAEEAVAATGSFAYGVGSATSIVSCIPLPSRQARRPNSGDARRRQ
jgi:hypothetical protein